MKNKYDTEKDEVIRPRKRQVIKQKTKKSDHKHDWIVIQVSDKNLSGVVVSKYMTICAYCNKEK